MSRIANRMRANGFQYLEPARPISRVIQTASAIPTTTAVNGCGFGNKVNRRCRSEPRNRERLPALASKPGGVPNSRNSLGFRLPFGFVSRSITSKGGLMAVFIKTFRSGGNTALPCRSPQCPPRMVLPSWKCKRFKCLVEALTASRRLIDS
jgi:hypothetical protein